MKLRFEINNPKRTLSFISTFASKNANRPVLTYFNVLIQDGTARIIMTDSYKLINMTIGEVKDKKLSFNKMYDTSFLIMIAKSLSRKRFVSHMYIDTESELVGFGEDKEKNIHWTSPMEGNYPKIDHLLEVMNKAHVYDENISQYLGVKYSFMCIDRHFKISVPDIESPIILDYKVMEEFIRFVAGIDTIKMYCVGELKPVAFEFKIHQIVFQCLYLPLRSN